MVLAGEPSRKTPARNPLLVTPATNLARQHRPQRAPAEKMDVKMRDFLVPMQPDIGE